MKLLTVAIPSYNSQEYMAHAIDTLLCGGDEIEIIIVNDGSQDRTAEIAEEYAKKYPTIIKAIHQENGGHGEAVNTGLRHATGLYYKVVDSDDWVEEKALKRVLQVIREHQTANQVIDMYIANYVYERVNLGKRKVIHYKGVLPENVVFGWEDIGHFAQSQYMLMHSVIYRTELLRSCKLHLPKHTFYVDNIFVYTPLPYVENMYYMNVDLYRYYIGREDQSVNEKVMMGRIDQQIRVTKQMIQENKLREVTNEKLQRYMIKYITIMMTICTVFLMKGGTEQDRKKCKELWTFLKEQDACLYGSVKRVPLGMACQLQGPIGRQVLKVGYRMARKIIGFN